MLYKILIWLEYCDLERNHSAVLAGNDTFLTKNTQDRKKIHNSVKTYDILIKQKVSESWWSALSISDKKKLFSILGVAPNDPFFVQIGPKKQIPPTFFQNYWIATQVININWIP